MATFALDTNGDLLVNLGKTVILQGAQAIAQNLYSKLRIFLGEWFLDTSVGVPYLSVVYVKNPSLAVITQFFSGLVLGTPGITGLRSINVTLDGSTRVADVSFVALTDGATITAATLAQPFVVTQQGINVSQ